MPAKPMVTRLPGNRQITKARSTKTVLIYSRHAVTAAGFRTLAAEDFGFIYSECDNTPELPGQAALGKPDLLMVDMDRSVTLELLGELRHVTPRTAIILWIEEVSPEFVRHAIELGIHGVIGKDASLATCTACLAGVARGQVWIEEELSRKLLCTRTVKLTPREGQIVSLLTQGLKNKEIAWRMKITEGTAKAYLTRLFQKTGANDRFELAMYAVRNLAAESGEFRPMSLGSLKREGPAGDR